MKKLFKSTMLFAAAISLASCGGSGENPSTDAAKDSIAADSAAHPLKDIVMYSVPSPIETFTILKMSGSNFDKSLMNPVDNIKKYSSNFSKSVNLGAYSTDLSFCYMYKQNQDFNNYLKNINELTSSLGIDGSYGQSITTRLKANEGNLDSLMNIAQEASINADEYLRENQRQSTTVLIATGSWVEGMHIIATLANKKPDGVVTGLVADQKIALKNLIRMLEQFESDAELTAVLADIKGIATIYEGLKTVKADALVSEDNIQNSIGNNTTLELTKEQLASILEKVEALRTKFTN